MRKIITFFPLFFMCCMSAFSQKTAEPLYVIKDGKLNPNVEVVDYPNKLLMEQGDGYLSFRKASIDHQRIFFKLKSNSYNIKNMNLVVEYQLPETALCDSNHKTNLMFNKCAEKNAPTMTVRAFSPYGNLCSTLYIDGKFDENSAKGFVTYDGFAFVQDSVIVNTFELDYMDRWEWKNDENDPLPGDLKVKNLYYVKSVSGKTPFFCSKFDGVNTWDETWNADKHYQTGAVLTCKNRKHPKDFKILYMNQPDNWTCSDGSGYLSSELLYGLLIKSAYNYRHKWITDKDTLSISNILLPKGTKKIKLECLLRAEVLKADAPSEKIPMYVSFDNDKLVRRLFEDSIPDKYTSFECEVDVPAGAKSMDLIFAQAPTASYIVDNLIISSLNTLQQKPKKTAPSSTVKR